MTITMNTETNERDPYTNEATYCPEDNKLRLYVGRVPRDEYLALKKEGWKSTPKQDCDFVATWTPKREDTALEYAGYIGDEDQSPEDRAADRAERFGDYRDKRRTEAHGYADSFEAGPMVHGYQNQARAERAANRHNRQRVCAINQWSKAEYWQQRTEGVIKHALYKSSAHCRRGRILTLEAEQRKHEKFMKEAKAIYQAWQGVAVELDKEKAYKRAYYIANHHSSGYYHTHPRTGKEGQSLYWLLSDEVDPITGHEAAALALSRYPEGGPCQAGTYAARWADHFELRLTYERAMLEAEGGTMADEEMIAGGFIGKHQICKVNKSPATGKVVSVGVWGPHPWRKNSDGTKEMGIQTVNIQRMGQAGYRAPTPEELAEFKKLMKERRAETQKPKQPALINPTIDTAKVMQEAINKRIEAERDSYFSGRGKDPATPIETTQANYSKNSKGSYASFGVYYIRIDDQGRPLLDDTKRDMYCSRRDKLPILCRVRAGYLRGDGVGYRIIVLTDKPQKAFPELKAKPVKVTEEVTA